MSITVTVEIAIKAEKLTEFMELMPNMLPDTRSYKGCESAQVNVEQNTSTVFMVEVWGSRPDYDAYFKWRVESGGLDAVMDFATAEPIFRFFDQHPEI
jgi:quinol monooxygenase YgiN